PIELSSRENAYLLGHNVGGMTRRYEHIEMVESIRAKLDAAAEGLSVSPSPAKLASYRAELREKGCDPGPMPGPDDWPDNWFQICFKKLPKRLASAKRTVEPARVMKETGYSNTTTEVGDPTRVIKVTGYSA
ncbi:MAG: hypothetical protein ACLPKB_32585, partial [Xanthobacteraceae bacterium]